MMKNDITYEYRVFTNRLIDVEAMEIGRCTSKVIKELKPKDKVDGRFFHTSDTDEWFFCWNGKLQKLNLKGDSDVNAALAKVEKLIGEANDAVADAKKTADVAKDAADNATAAVESINGKADKSDVDFLANVVDTKADAAVVDTLSVKVDAIKVPTKVSELTNDAGYLTTHQDITGKQDVITDLETIRSGAALGATALQSIPEEYITETELSSKGYLTDQSLNGYATEEYVVDAIEKIDIPTVPTKVSEFENDAKYLTVDEASSMFAPIGSEGGDMGGYATKKYVDDAIDAIDIPTVPTNVSEFINDAGYLTAHQDISGKQDVIADLEDIRSGAALGATALQAIPEDYVTETELDGKGYLTEHQDISGKQDVINDLETIRSGAALGATALQVIPEEYVTEGELSAKGYLTVDVADLKYAPIGSVSDGSGNYATQDFVRSEISKINIPTVPTNVSAFTNDAGYLTEHQDISGKQDVITDLEDIRANAELAKTALQAIPEEYVTEDELSAKGYATIDKLNEKQDAIDDLTAIRSGAALGATALQAIPEEYVTEDELAAKGYLTEHQSLDNYYTKKEIDDKIDAINISIGQAIDITNTILA